MGRGGLQCWAVLHLRSCPSFSSLPKTACPGAEGANSTIHSSTWGPRSLADLQSAHESLVSKTKAFSKIPWLTKGMLWPEATADNLQRSITRLRKCLPRFSTVKFLFFHFVTKKHFVEEVLCNFVNIPFPVKLSPTGSSVYSRL